jgi:plasmid maintenance system antidote protein VapI
MGKRKQIENRGAVRLPADPAKWLRIQLGARNMTGRALGQIIGMGESYISDLRNGKRTMSPEIFLQLRDFFL